MTNFIFLTYKMIIILYVKKTKFVKYKIVISKHDIENTILKLVRRQNDILGLLK